MRLVQKQLAYFNIAMQGKTASEAPKKKGAQLPFTQVIFFLVNYHTCRTELFSVHAGLLRRIFGRQRK
jgi:hypothetical protein